MMVQWTIEARAEVSSVAARVALDKYLQNLAAQINVTMILHDGNAVLFGEDFYTGRTDLDVGPFRLPEGTKRGSTKKLDRFAALQLRLADTLPSWPLPLYGPKPATWEGRPDPGMIRNPITGNYMGRSHARQGTMFTTNKRPHSGIHYHCIAWCEL